MPGSDTLTGTRIFEWLVLQPCRQQAVPATVRQQLAAVARYEVCHFAAVPLVTVQPEAAVQGVDQTIAPVTELARRQSVRFVSAVGPRRVY